MTTKTTDKKGRIMLGRRFANKTFIVVEIDETEVHITEAAVIPKRELWLNENAEAKASVMRGLAPAKAGEFVAGPDLDADAELFCDDDA